MLHQIKAEQFYTDLGLYQLCQVIQKKVEFKDFSRLLNDFPVLLKAYLIFKEFSRKSSKFKYFSSLCKSCMTVYAQTRLSLPLSLMWLESCVHAYFLQDIF